MASVTFQRGCRSCRTTDGINHMIWWTQEAEYQLYRNGVPGDNEDDIEDNDFLEDSDVSHEYISNQEMAELIAEWHMDTEHRCEFCGSINCFEFWDMKINGELLEDFEEDDYIEDQEEGQFEAEDREEIFKPKSDRQKLHLKGNLKSVKEISYKTIEANSGPVQKSHKEREGSFSFFGTERKKDFLYIFNENGNKEEEIFYNSDGRIDHVKKFIYNGEGLLTEEILYDVEKNVVGNFVYRFDGQGRCIKIDYFNAKHELESFEKYQFDEYGNRIEEALYNSKEELQDKHVFEFDSKGNMVESKSVDADGSIGSIYLFKYDNNRNKVEEVQQNSYGMDTKYTYKYDRLGNLKEKCVFDSERKLTTKWVYYYDEKNNLIEWNEFEADSEYYRKLTYKYEYDDHDNWIKRIDYIGDRFPNYQIERSLEYF